MRAIIRFIKRLFGKYETGYEYWVYISQIHVDPAWRNFRIGKDKFTRKMIYYHKTGEFESKIILDRDFNLIDGYSSFRIAEISGIEKVPVYFVQ